MFSLKLRGLALALLSLALGQSAWGCPAVSRLADLNCDGKATVVVLGDSLVRGIGDTKNSNTGGYIIRTQEKFPGATIYGYGVPGLRTQPLLSTLKKTFAEGVSSELKLKLLEADLVVLDLGRNDRWLFGLPEATLRNLKRIRALIEKELTDLTGVSPLIVTAVLMYPNRGAQGPWVKELDALILKSHTPRYPADLRFDTVSKRLLAPDNIHPTSKGYASMAATFVKYLLKEYKTYAALARADNDNDGLYDVYEREKFGTDPTNPDTDGDGIKDGADL